MKKTTFTAETIVAFHIGRGGRFYNGGHLTFLGEGKISDYTEDCWAPKTVDDNEELIDDNSPEAEWTDCNGNSVGLTNAEYQSGIGRIDMDGEYNTTYTMRLGDIEEDSKEWDAIFADNTSDAEDAQIFFRPQLGIQSLDELANYINENEDWQNDIADIIERNCREDQTGEDEWHVCRNYDEMIILNDECEAIVKEYM
jgi:hypothetical protein